MRIKTEVEINYYREDIMILNKIKNEILLIEIWITN